MAAIDYGTLIFKNKERVNKTFLDTELELDGLTLNFWKGVITITDSNDEKRYYLNTSEHLVLHICTPLGFEVYAKVLDDKKRNRFVAKFTYQGNHYTVFFGYGIDDIMTDTIYREYGFSKREQRLLNAFTRQNCNQ